MNNHRFNYRSGCSTCFLQSSPSLGGSVNTVFNKFQFCPDVVYFPPFKGLMRFHAVAIDHLVGGGDLDEGVGRDQFLSLIPDQVLGIELFLCFKIPARIHFLFS
jgi:hypothetical protein